MFYVRKIHRSRLDRLCPDNTSQVVIGLAVAGEIGAHFTRGLLTIVFLQYIPDDLRFQPESNPPSFVSDQAGEVSPLRAAFLRNAHLFPAEHKTRVQSQNTTDGYQDRSNRTVCDR